MLNSKQLLGQKGEQEAATFLKANGYTIVARNYRCRYGEIDIIARQDGYLVFAEVKTRRTTLFGSPQSSVTPAKQRQIIRTAQFYLLENNLTDVAARFDVVSITEKKPGKTRIELLKNAFELS